MKKFKRMILELRGDSKDIEEKIFDFFKENPSPKDEQIHKFADDEGIDKHEFEEKVYAILGSFIGEGRSKNFDGTFDKEQLKKGIGVEMEHTTNSLIARKIAWDHLAEIDDYYTRLAKMEKDAEK